MVKRTIASRTPKTQSLSADTLRTRLHYDPETGDFRWKSNPHGKRNWNSRFSGKIAGCTKTLGYRVIRIDDVLYGAHRLAFLYMTGRWPYEEVDHIDCDPSNNRWSNLREATRYDNNHNLRTHCDNISGRKGVLQNHKGWAAKIRAFGRTYHLGTFQTPEDAHAAYQEASLRLHGAFSRSE